jgi:hypothetical protein
VDISEFEKSLSDPARKKINSLYKKYPGKKKILLRAGAEFISDSNLPEFEAFVSSAGFAAYLRERGSASVGRMEHTIELFIRRIHAEIDSGRLSSIAEVMASKKYSLAERSFFKVPVDRDGFEIFERAFISIGEQNTSKLDGFIEFAASDLFITFKNRYREPLDLYSALFQRCTDLYLAKTHDEFTGFMDILLAPDLSRFIFAALDLGSLQPFVKQLFEIFYLKIDPENFAAFLKIYSKRYPRRRSGDDRYSRAVFARLMNSWYHFIFFSVEAPVLIKEFLYAFGDLKDELELFIWDTVFSLPPEKSIKAVTLLVSTVFTSLKGFYQNDNAIVKFLIKNIIAVISEMEIKDIGGGLFRIVLKLLLALKVDRRYLKRRADFFEWVKGRTSSVLVELQIVRMLLFEYIFIALNLVPKEYNFIMTKFCDSGHERFCSVLDGIMADPFRLRSTDRDKPLEGLLEMLRDNLWAGMKNDKFRDDLFKLDEIRGVAETSDREDAVLTALSMVNTEHMRFYHETLMIVFRNYPEKLDDAVRHDYWSRVDLDAARPYARGVALPVVGGVRILEGTGGAYTDGATIYLPPYINYFSDPLEPILENRNLSFYIALTLHEAGHLVAGSFAFNLVYYMNILEIPDLFRFIHNTFEDYRIEKFLSLIKAHHQIDELLMTMNSYYSIVNFRQGSSVSFTFLYYIFDEAFGCNVELKKVPEYNRRISAIFDMTLNTGRFRGLYEMAEYGISRLRSMDTANPLAAYPLSREFYEIMKHWPEVLYEDLLDPKCNPKGVYRHDPDGGAGAGAPPPMTREQLDQLYKDYNDNPAAFLEGCGLRVYPELLPEDKRKGLDEKPGIPFYAEENDLLREEFFTRYEDAGTIDFSHRTKADDLAAQEQLKPGNKRDTRKVLPDKDKKVKGDKKASKKKKKFVYNINPRTGSRTKISEIKEFTVTGISRDYFRRFEKWRYISNIIYRQLSRILPDLEEAHDTSAFDGEMNMELVIEALSDKSRTDGVDLFDIFMETRRSLEVVVGLDASGSTSYPIDSGAGPDGDTIIDIEKAFAIIFGRAMSHLAEKVTLFAFDSVTSTNVYRAATIDAVSSFAAGAANRDGDFVRYVKEYLVKSPAEVKYFFLLSDGRPSAENYDGKEALDDTLIAMRETVNAGIKLIYFNFDNIKGDYFDHFQQEATYARYFSHPAQLLPAIPELVNVIVRSIR